MKKIMLLFTLMCVVFCLRAQSQGCSPDLLNIVLQVFIQTAQQIYQPLMLDSHILENITIITPNDTDVVYNGFNINVTIDDIVLTSVTGLPSNFDYNCDPPSCTFSGGSIECAELFSNSNPTASDVGVYQIVFETTTSVSGVPIIGTTTQDDVIDYYYLEISNTTSSLNMLKDFTFELKDVYPNPVMNNVNIQFISGTNKDIVFSIYNLLGVEIESRFLTAKEV